MIIINFSFFATLQGDFGEEQQITCNEPITLIQLLDSFQSENGEKASAFFLENGKIKDEFIILIDGRNVHALEGLNTVLKENCEVSFFPLLAGG
ncbi:MAG: MoaD/ThiS family protein [Candidatus Heimdallarchaeota archaeon]|nr:MAG: MoaD/ThiS family protein [Candidatus Heimdallarchaeota archaeon]